MSTAVVPSSSWHSKPDYNTLLPYPVSIPEEPTSQPERVLEEIERGLAACILSGDLAVGANSWTKRLHAYLNVKYPLPLESRLRLADLYFQLLVSPRVYDSSMTQYWAVYLLKLIKKQPPELPDDAWSVPWRPLYDTIESIIQQKQREKAHENDRRNVTTVMRTVEFTKRFFLPESTKEILEEFLPNLFPFSHKVIPGALPSILSSPSATLSILSETLSTFTPTMLLRAQAYMVLFLPTNVADVSLWFDTFLSVWTWQRNSALWDTLWLDLYSRVARDRIGHIQWEPHVVQHMFTVTLKLLEVPVGRGTGIAGRLKIGSKDKLLSFMKEKDVRASCARLIVYMMSPQEGNQVLYELKKLIQAVETFFHPSNHTHRLSSILAGFLRNLTTYFLKRLSEESEPDCRTPEEFRITEEMKSDFVTTLKHVAFLSMFGKDDMVVNNSITALRCLGYVKPELIVPPLMEKVSYSLESLTETHRTNSSIIALSSLARIILTRKMYPMGATHILDLFNMVLPGIDANDSIKTITTFKFISSCLFCLPLMEADNPSPTLTVPPWSDELIEETVFSVTKGFEEFAINFLERIFALLENMPEREAGMTHMMLYCADLFFQSLSPEIFELVLAKTIAFVSNNVIASAIKTIGIFCCTLTTSNRKPALAKFVPLCCTSILEEIENGAGSDVNATSQSDLKLTWFQSILAGVLKYSGAEILKYQEQILETITTMTKLKSKRGYKYAGKGLRNLLRSLTWTYTLDERNFSMSTMSDPEFRRSHFQQWGVIQDSHALSLEWHVPSSGEIDFALHMVHIFLKPMMAELAQIVDGTNTSAVDKNDFIRKLTLTRYVVKGISTLTVDVPANTCPADQEVHEHEHHGQHTHPSRKIINAGYCLMDATDVRCQDIRKTRLELGLLLHNLVRYLQSEREDDTKSIKIVLKIINVFLTNRGETKEKYESRRAVIKLLKMASQDYSVHTKRSQRYPRYVLARRLHMLHTERLFLNATIAPKLAIHQELMEDLLDLSMSHYTAIRKLAQSFLDTAISCFQDSKYTLLAKIFQHIETAKLSSDGLKGALYLLRMRPFQSAYLRDWGTMAGFMKVIFDGRHEQKESIQKLIEVVYLEFTYRYVSPTLTFEITEETVKAAARMLARDDTETLAQEAALKIGERNDANVKIYLELIQDLLKIVHANNLHWRFARMAILFLGILLTRKDQPVNWEVVEYLAKAAVSELIVLRSVALKALNNNIYVHKQQVLGERPLEYLRQLNTPISCEKDYVDAQFHDQEYLGWYHFPKQFKVYSPNNGQMAATLRQPLEKHVSHFLEEGFWDKCIVYMSQEQYESDITVSSHNLLFFKGLFEIFDTQLLSLLEKFILTNANNYAYKNVQKTLAEIVGGMLRGSKHWEYAKWKHMLDFITPLLTEKIFPNLTLEVIPLWTAAMQWAMTNRDPRRFSIIIESLMRYPLDLETSNPLSQVKRLISMRTMLVIFNWRCLPYARAVFSRCTGMMEHPYKEIRDMAATIIADVFQLFWRPFAVEEDPLGQYAAQNVALVDEFMDQLLRTLLAHRESRESESPTDHSDYVGMSKSVLTLVRILSTSSRIAPLLPYLTRLVPEMFYMQDDDDQELQKFATGALELLFQNNLPPSMLREIIEMFRGLLKSPSWHLRSKSLPVVQIFLFRNLFGVDERSWREVIDMLVEALLDPQLEVRTMASNTISGLVRCSQRNSIEELLATPLARRNKRSESASPSPRTSTPTPAGYSESEAILRRHAGVSGVAALIQAFPYGGEPGAIPKWMPDALISLVPFISDPIPISTTAKKTFLDFRRTHQETWVLDKLAFTEEQLDTLSDLLVSPSYYA
ncbi:hypothetical protein K493DRAFT_312115 [Basidiobolus meristosporus CBS 931.73]|uniref:ARM repeat-containing protein n=1 Tax=Basidiobolus meristosporus CBS 931.73 TaxID=1314790 RepID=A0A1Y1YWG9_9FUNG|nr:hypothetical protein K493DRAFT_312115 [Basidiobolus meristosporus CBS 931.73]|eukprot:ORY02341.1 hypothetical protein K493DRAFT_312115 [Basidiobolus meristosporus CBS 931.73]